MNKEPRSKTGTLIEALKILARDIESDDGVPEACLLEAADRLEELHQYIRVIVPAYESSVLKVIDDNGGVPDEIEGCRAILETCPLTVEELIDE